MEEDSIICRTKDALLADIEVSFQYQLSTNLPDLLTLYSDWGENYENAFILIAANQIRNTMAEFKALQVFYNRTDIETAMTLELTERFSKLNIQILSF